MKTTQLVQLALSVLVLLVASVQDVHAVMKRVRAAPKSRSDAEKRRLRYQTEQQERNLGSSSSDEGTCCVLSCVCLCVLICASVVVVVISCCRCLSLDDEISLNHAQRVLSR